MSLYPLLYAREVALAEKELAFGGWGYEGSLSDSVTLHSGTSCTRQRRQPSLWVGQLLCIHRRRGTAREEPACLLVHLPFLTLISELSLQGSPNPQNFTTAHLTPSGLGCPSRQSGLGPDRRSSAGPSHLHPTLEAGSPRLPNGQSKLPPRLGALPARASARLTLGPH